MRKIIIVALASVAAACGEASDQPAGPQAETNTPATAEAMQQQLLAMEEPLRLATFYRAIDDAGRECQQVESAVNAGTHEGSPVWQATCENGSAWTLVIGDNGIVSVVNAAEQRIVTDTSANTQ